MRPYLLFFFFTRISFQESKEESEEKFKVCVLLIFLSPPVKPFSYFCRPVDCPDLLRSLFFARVTNTCRSQKVYELY